MSETPLSYYGKPIIKEPVWKPEIPAYFFVGGLAGASAALSAAARLAGNEELARRSLFVAAAGVTASPYLLIKDLGRPARFYNMMRVFKVTSPMSVGTWIVSASGQPQDSLAHSAYDVFSSQLSTVIFLDRYGCRTEPPSRAFWSTILFK